MRAKMQMLPTSFDEVTPDWLGRYLSRGYPGTKVCDLTIGDRSDGTATRLALDVRYAEGSGNRLPTKLFLKSLLGSPIAPVSMYRCEMEFYRTMRPALSLETPRIYGSEFDEATAHFFLLMEDVNGRGGCPGVATRPWTPDEVGSVLDTLADLHAPYWNSPRLDSELSWMETHLTGRTAEFFRTLAPDILISEYRASPYKKWLFDPVGYFSPDRLWRGLWKLQEVNEGDIPTALHGDPHVANTYVLPGAKGGLLDWQLMRKGCWAHDVTYAIVSSLTVEDRRAFEVDLLHRYTDAMSRQGVTMPQWDQIWLRHRQNAVWGAVMWLLTPTPLYDEKRLTILLERSRAAVEDLKSFEALDCG